VLQPAAPWLFAADIPDPRYMDDSGHADQRGPGFCSLLSTKRRMSTCLSLMQLWHFGLQGCWGLFV
jgi:hypothetical protein